jgi:hypothetical protein
MDPRPKTGVLTFHRCINYGSYWQARCLVDGLRARGHDVVLLDHDSWRINVAEWRCALRPLAPAPVSRGDRLRYGLKMLKFARALASLPLSPRFALDNPAGMASYASVVVGSDEVWNLWHPWYGRCPLFFGDGVRADRLIAYAGSFGNYHASEGLDPCWAERLRRFDSLSVRDDNSRSILRAALGGEPDVVLDPCLQFPPRPEGRWRGPRRPFVALYGHSFSPALAAEVRRWAASRGYRLVSIGYRNDWADAQWIAAGPHDFAQAMARAEAVVTNFFHGCVFALRNARPFVCETSAYRSIKVGDLMRLLGGEKHLVSSEAPAAGFADRLDEPPAPDMLRSIERLRRTSEGYLDRALGASSADHAAATTIPSQSAA